MAQTGQNAETPRDFAPRPKISHVVFDFDGTLSWLRHGWPELMAGLFLKHLPETLRTRSSPSRLDTVSAIHDTLLDDILALNGKSSIYQIEKCTERVLERGGPKLDPGQTLQEYQELLQATVRARIFTLQRGDAQPDDFVVHGARPLLQQLRARGLVLIILSGTLEPQVKEEAELLKIAEFFGSHIYGGTANLQQSSKKAVIERLLHEENLSGDRLLSFGDGPVEIRLTKEAGGLAVGVASDEDHNGSGQMHPQKARQLREAGADLLIPDYRDPDGLLKCLLGS